MKYMQSPIKIIPFYLLPYYNANIIRRGFSIKIYIGDPPYKPYFITLILQDQIIIGPMKKTVALYVVRDLALLD